MFLVLWHNLRSKRAKTILIIHDSKEHLEFGSHDFDGLLENHDFVLLVNLGVMQDFNSPPNEAQPVISPHITQCNKMPIAQTPHSHCGFHMTEWSYPVFW